MFGKPVAEYLRFERGILFAILVVGLLRLGLSLAGVPMGTVKMVSVTAALLVGVLYVGVAAAVKGFGAYRHLLPLVFFQALLVNAIAAAAIGLAALTGQPNAYTAPEYTNLPNYLPHAMGHLVGTLVVAPIAWGLASLAMLVTRAVGRGAPARAGA
jgi:hypothetical protein